MGLFTNFYIFISMLATAILAAKVNQSPIDILPKDAIEIDLGPLEFHRKAGKSDKLGAKAVIRNDGKGFSISSPEINEQLVKGGGLFGEYRLAQFHMHWGTEDPLTNLRSGSEHTIAGRRSPAEVHFVFYRDSYKDIAAAIKSKGYESLAVIGVLIEDEDSVKTAPKKRKRPFSDPAVINNNAAMRQKMYKTIADGLTKVVDLGNTTTIDLSTFPFMHMLPDDTRHFWSYAGSLTTPDYNEIVAWRVMEDYIVIPKATLKTIAETVKDGQQPPKVVNKNYREVQKLNGRTVYFHKASKPMKKPRETEECVTIQKPRKYDCALDYVEAITRRFIEDSPIPTCQNDNTYMPLQCHRDECWCAAKDGRQIGSRVSLVNKDKLKCDSFKVRGEVSCQKIRSAAILEEGAFQPDCDTDGSFHNKQCYRLVDSPFSLQKFCWCSMKTGERVPGTLSAEGSMWDKKTDCKDITDTNELCQRNQIGFQRHPFDCRLYTFCLFDSFRICTCPKGTFYNVWTQTCELRKSNNKC